jgi:DNA-binding LytR/AlgR family response regulator
VEDDARILQFCADAIRGLGNSVVVFGALSAEEALVLLDEESIDGAFIDIELPGMNGFALAKKIRERDAYHFLPIVFATGADKDIPETYKQYHNFDYIAKPYTKDAFSKIATRFLEEVEARKKLSPAQAEREIAFRHDGGLARIRFSDILYATTTHHRKIRLVTRQQEYFRSDITLHNLITEINEAMFVPCNKSCLVNVSNIAQINPITYKTMDILFRDAPEKNCQLSLRYRKAVEDLFSGEQTCEKGEMDTWR